jgi:predicted amidophosphoribosyltransferase
MTQRACEECGEMADAAKAFCPSCGHAFVTEQKREQPSEFEQMDGTQQFGKTMYNQMLSDMGLNLKAPRDKPRVQVIQALPTAESRREAPAIQPPAAAAPAPAEKKSNKVLIFGIIAAFLILGFLVVLAAAVLLWLRFG